MRAIHYAGSQGRLHEIATMVPEHMANALAKLERDEPHRREEIEALREELQRRPAQGRV